MARAFGSTIGVSVSDRIASTVALPAGSFVSIFCRYYRTGQGGGGTLFGRAFQVDTAGNNGFVWRWNDGQASMTLVRQAATTNGEYLAGTAAANTLNTWIDVVLTWDRTTTTIPTCYINGVASTMTAFATMVGAEAALNGNLYLGNSNLSTREWDGAVGDFAIWDGVQLTAAEAMALHQGADPKRIRSKSLAQFISSSNGTARAYKGAQPITAGTRAFKARQEVQAFQTPAKFQLFDAGAATGAMTGAATVTFTPSGTMSGAGALVGTSAVVFTPSGTMRGAGALAGAPTVVFTPSATLGGVGALAGSSPVAFAPSGTLTAKGALVGTSPVVFTPSGTMAGNGVLSGASTISFTATGTATQPTGAMRGNATVSFTPAGALAGSGALAGGAVITFTASAAAPAAPNTGRTAYATVLDRINELPYFPRRSVSPAALSVATYSRVSSASYFAPRTVSPASQSRIAA